MSRLSQIAAISVGVLSLPAAASPSAADLEFFEKEVRPVLVESCYECHSAEAKKLKAGLYVDSREGVMLGGDSGPSVVAGDPEKSLLIESIRYHNVDLQMPPKTRLSEGAVGALEKWVKMGAPWPEGEGATVKRAAFDLEGRKQAHWCWHAPEVAAIPEVERRDWPLGPIDRFILAKLEEAGLEPAADADRRSWIRRVSFDLIGLPPTPEEVEAFVADPSDEAFEKVVDRLLGSPQFGEKWARHWLDLMRYAESYGHEFDFSIPQAWRYRDYVVRAFNADVPYDQFVTEHVAGDLMESPRRNPQSGINESVIGTGSWWLGEAVHAPTDVRGDEAIRIDNQVDTFSKSFLGVTVSCARCHDHKFDAISTKDYYSLAGYLQSSRRQLAMLDPGGKIAAGASRLRDLQVSASASLAGHVAGSMTKAGPGVIASFDEGMPAGWRSEGEAFPSEPSGKVQQLALAEPAAPGVPAGVIHSGLHGSSLQGALRSPTFTIEKPVIHLHMKASGPVEVRLVIEGYFMQHYNGLLFKGTRLPAAAADTKGKYAWKKLGGDLRKYVGQKAYLEVLDDGTGFVAIDYIGYDKPKVTPLSSNPELVIPPEIGAELEGLEKSIPTPVRALALTDGTAENESVHIRGSHKKLGELAPRGILTALGGAGVVEDESGSGRLQLVAELISPENPLTSRVYVNRIWHHLMGRGIVATVDDFGEMGQAPTHPGLLDWLAIDFPKQGWSTKKLIREMVLSRTYRMSSTRAAGVSDEDIEQKDAANLLMHKFRVRRLSSEAIRDAVLRVSGGLNPKLGGPSIPVHLTAFMEGRGRPKSGPLDGGGRRSLYTRILRNFLPPFQMAFDMPVPFSTIGKRSSSNVPAQSLTLMNDPFVAGQAKLWAGELVKLERGKRIEAAYQRAFSRIPTESETRQLEDFLVAQGELLSCGQEDIRLWADVCHLLFNKKEFIYLK